MRNILITTECVADLPQHYYDKLGVDIIFFDIKTSTGVFRDTFEIDSENVIEYMKGGEKEAISVIPSANDYKNFFSKKLREYSEVVHICISGGISGAYKNAYLAKVKMGREGEKVHVIDSKHLSCGQGLLVLEACKCLEKGMTGEEIASTIEQMIPRVITTFLADNADYLYYNGKVKKAVKLLCNILRIHPVLAMIEGKLTLKKIYFGNYNRVSKKYIKYLLGHAEKIDKNMGCIVYAGCSEDILERVRKLTAEHVVFDEVIEQPASATVSCNCGPKTFGIMFVEK